MKKELELYLHIPFCMRKCNYCDFLSFYAGERERERYVERLIEEIGANKEEDRLVTTIFFGGGTPSILSGQQIKRIMDQVRAQYQIAEHPEITMEANPGTLTREKLQVYKSCGINRLSMGLQSADDRELKLLGRIHTYQEFLENYKSARDLGFDNINVDLMSALPGQTVESWRNTLDKVIYLEPEHISAYSLIVEEGTPFHQMYESDVEKRNKGEVPDYLPGEEAERQMYYDTKEKLRAGGYHRYEISNYAKEGKSCRHNAGYWRRKDYLGLGLGASSLVSGYRFTNTDDMGEYMDGKLERKNPEKLSQREAMEEFMFLGLRMTEGIREEDFNQQFQEDFSRIYGKSTEKLQKEKLLSREKGIVALTEKGIDVSNYVLSCFLQD